MSGRYRIWRSTTFVGRFASPEEQAADEINGLHEDHGWVPLAITAVPSGTVLEFAILFDTRTSTAPASDQEAQP